MCFLTRKYLDTTYLVFQNKPLRITGCLRTENPLGFQVTDFPMFEFLKIGTDPSSTFLEMDTPSYDY
jgi:hypothetical protein